MNQYKTPEAPPSETKNTVANKTKSPDKIELLNRIETMVNPLNPPVFAFERSIRKSPFMILVSVLLSSRTKDAVTHQAVSNLFSTVETPEQMVQLPEARIAELIFPVGFYKQKAKNIKKLAQILIDSQEPGIPSTFEGLTALPGVGRKTANLVLSLAFNRPSIAVDIHVFRISQRLGWAAGEKPEQVEEQLKEAFPPEQWNRINQVLVGFGQTVCKPISPSCGQCSIAEYCPSAQFS